MPFLDPYNKGSVLVIVTGFIVSQTERMSLEKSWSHKDKLGRRAADIVSICVSNHFSNTEL